MSTIINYLQEYIKSKDNHPELVKDYFLKSEQNWIRCKVDDKMFAAICFDMALHI